MMRRLQAILLIVLVSIYASTASAQETPAKPSVFIEVRADREDAIYKVGETITFRVTALTCTVSGNNAVKAKDATPVEGVKLAYRITGDGGMEKAGEIVSALTPVTVECSLDRPGFVLCAVGETALSRWWQYKGRGGAGVDPLKIEAGVTKPADFDAFWSDSLAELRKVSMYGTTTEKVESPDDKVEVYKIKVPSLGVGPDNIHPVVTGHLCKPAGAAPRSCPAILRLPGAGVRSSRPGIADASRFGMISLTISAHGIEVGQPDAYYAEQREPISNLYKIGGADKAEALRNSYYRTIFMRVARALEYLKSLPEWDGKTLIISGGSQGGGLSLIGAGLDPQVTACIANYPGFCDQYGYLKQKPNGWPQMIRLDKDGKPQNPMMVETAAYFDAANFALRINIDTVVTTGFIDTTCPPSSVYAAYNLIPSVNKRIITSPNNGHEGPPWDQAAFIEQHLANMKAQAADH